MILERKVCLESEAFSKIETLTWKTGRRGRRRTGTQHTHTHSGHFSGNFEAFSRGETFVLENWNTWELRTGKQDLIEANFLETCDPLITSKIFNLEHWNAWKLRTGKQDLLDVTVEIVELEDLTPEQAKDWHTNHTKNNLEAGNQCPNVMKRHP